jgi:hypothetical protein
VATDHTQELHKTDWVYRPTSQTTGQISSGVDGFPQCAEVKFPVMWQRCGKNGFGTIEPIQRCAQ